ncbi:hypothetical protein V6N11_043892 [Hibiscus sabdariffa]|uniref:Uncharacterized protein n=1 Tax=Hibiscus sabdariffa TaxID=183260 RepID=A0ABR2RDW9_9ROSI
MVSASLLKASPAVVKSEWVKGQILLQLLLGGVALLLHLDSTCVLAHMPMSLPRLLKILLLQAVEFLPWMSSILPVGNVWPRLG